MLDFLTCIYINSEPLSLFGWKMVSCGCCCVWTLRAGPLLLHSLLGVGVRPERSQSRRQPMDRSRGLDSVQLSLATWVSLAKQRISTRSRRVSIYRPPLFQLSETHKNKEKQLLGFSFLPDDHYNPYLSSGEKENPQRCLLLFLWVLES